MCLFFLYTTILSYIFRLVFLTFVHIQILCHTSWLNKRYYIKSMMIYLFFSNFLYFYRKGGWSFQNHAFLFSSFFNCLVESFYVCLYSMIFLTPFLIQLRCVINYLSLAIIPSSKGHCTYDVLLQWDMKVVRITEI